MKIYFSISLWACWGRFYLMPNRVCDLWFFVHHFNNFLQMIFIIPATITLSLGVLVENVPSNNARTHLQHFSRGSSSSRCEDATFSDSESFDKKWPSLIEAASKMFPVAGFIVKMEKIWHDFTFRLPALPTIWANNAENNAESDALWTAYLLWTQNWIPKEF